MKINIANNNYRYPVSLDLETIQALKEARQAASHRSAAGGRFAAYDYLEVIYSIYVAWKLARSATRNARALAAALDIPMRQGVSVIRIVIEATWPSAETKQKSRWTRALECAHAEMTAPRSLISFIKAHGGVAGCARLAAVDDPKKRTDRDDWA